MTAPRITIDLDRIEQNTRVLVDRLGARGIGVTAITKATLGSAAVGAAMLRGGASGLGDSRIENLAKVAIADGSGSRTLIRSPMPSQVDLVVRAATTSLNTERTVLRGLGEATTRQRRSVADQPDHRVILMVELGDLREGVAVDDVVAAAGYALVQPGLLLVGLGTNLACQNGVVPSDRNMQVLSRLVDQVEAVYGVALPVVSGGNSATLDWALRTDDPWRVNDLRLGEAILLGLEPLHRTPIAGLHTDAFTLIGEVIEAAEKPARPWGELAQTAFGAAPPRTGSGTIRQVIVALGRQDTDPDGLVPPEGMSVLGMSSDHLVLDAGDHRIGVGDEIAFGLGYGALLRAMTSPYVEKSEHPGLSTIGPPTS